MMLTMIDDDDDDDLPEYLAWSDVHRAAPSRAPAPLAIFLPEDEPTLGEARKGSH